MDSHAWKMLKPFVDDADPLHIARRVIHLATENDDFCRIDDEVQSSLWEMIQQGGWQVFEEVVGPALIEHPYLIFVLDNPRQGRVLLWRCDPAKLVEWIAEYPDRRLHIIANATPVSGEPLGGLARLLLERWGERSGVRNALAATFHTGSPMGPRSQWFADKLAKLSGWSSDPDPNVRRWVNEQIEHYQGQLDQARMMEEEEGL